MKRIIHIFTYTFFLRRKKFWRAGEQQAVRERHIEREIGRLALYHLHTRCNACILCTLVCICIAYSTLSHLAASWFGSWMHIQAISKSGVYAQEQTNNNTNKSYSFWLRLCFFYCGHTHAYTNGVYIGVYIIDRSACHACHVASGGRDIIISFIRPKNSRNTFATRSCLHEPSIHRHNRRVFAHCGLASHSRLSTVQKQNKTSRKFMENRAFPMLTC